MAIQEKHVLILISTILITAVFITIMVSLPSFSVENKCLTVDIPNDLLCELKNENIVIAQHGYKHTSNVSDAEKKDGFDLLVSQDIKPTVYIAPYEYDNSHPFLFVLYMSEHVDSDILGDYSGVGLDNLGRSTAVIHIQDNIENYQMSIFDKYEVIRVDDVNTDIVSSEIQGLRVRILKEYTAGNNKTLVLGVIPYVPRLPWFHGIIAGFLKCLLVAWMLLILPYYVFYLISWRVL